MSILLSKLILQPLLLSCDSKTQGFFYGFPLQLRFASQSEAAGGMTVRWGKYGGR